MLSPLARQLTRVLAPVFAVLGLVLFLAPGWAAANFAWKVSPFVAMTMGGWFLGSAVIAWQAARIWDWPVVVSSLVYLWLFGLLETLVLIGFRDRVVLASPVAWLYVAALLLADAAALLGIASWWRERPAPVRMGPPMTWWVRGAVVFFVVFVSSLAFVAAVGRQGGVGTEGAVFPEPLTLFTLRAWAAYFAALALGAVPLVGAHGVEPVLAYARVGLTLVVPILFAAIVNFDKFDLASRPGGILYLAAYIGVFFYALAVLLAYRRAQAVRGAQTA